MCLKSSAPLVHFLSNFPGRNPQFYGGKEGGTRRRKEEEGEEEEEIEGRTKRRKREKEIEEERERRKYCEGRWWNGNC